MTRRRKFFKEALIVVGGLSLLALTFTLVIGALSLAMGRAAAHIFLKPVPLIMILMFVSQGGVIMLDRRARDGE